MSHSIRFKSHAFALLLLFLTVTQSTQEPIRCSIWDENNDHSPSAVEPKIDDVCCYVMRDSGGNFEGGGNCKDIYLEDCPENDDNNDGYHCRTDKEGRTVCCCASRHECNDGAPKWTIDNECPSPLVAAVIAALIAGVFGFFVYVAMWEVLRRRAGKQAARDKMKSTYQNKTSKDLSQASTQK